MNIIAWLELFFSKKQHPMDEATTRVLMHFMMTRDQGPDKELEEIFLYKLIDKRARVMFSQVSWQAVAFLAYITKNPGRAVMYLAAIRSRYQDLSTDSIAYTFPYGFLSDEDLDELWDAQKVNGQNLLDKELIS